MQMIILPHKQHIGHGQHDARAKQIHPVRQDSIRTKPSDTASCSPIDTAHTTIDRLKIIPPPRSTSVECDERSLGLSMILHLSAMRK